MAFSPQDKAKESWGITPPKKNEADAVEERGLSPRCTFGWDTYKAERNLNLAMRRSGAVHPRIAAWLAVVGVGVDQLKAAGGLAEGVVGADKFQASWITDANGKKARSKAPAVTAPVVRVLRGRLADPPHAVWAEYLGNDDHGKPYAGRQGVEGLVAESTGFVEVVGSGHAERVLLVTDDPADAVALAAATGLCAVAWVGDFRKLRLPDDGKWSPGPRSHQVRAVVLCGCVLKAPEKSAAAGDALGVKANELLAEAARGGNWDGGAFQATAVVPTPALAGDVLVAENGGVAIAAAEEDAEGNLVDRPSRVGWGYVWRRLAASVGEEEARRAITAALMGGIDRAQARLVRHVGTERGVEPNTADVPWGSVGSGGGGAGGQPPQAPPVASGHGGGGGDAARTPWISAIEMDAQGRLIMPQDQLAIAREFLWSQCVTRGVRQFKLKYWAGKLFTFEGAGWEELDGNGDQAVEMLRAQVHHWLSSFWKKQRRKDEEDSPVVPFAPSVDYCTAVVKAIVGECRAPRCEQLPVWMPHNLTADGEPVWGSSSRLFGRRRAAVDAGDGRAVPTGLVVGQNGMVDLEEVAATGKVRMRPQSADLFNTTVLPFDIPVKELEAALAATADADEMERRFDAEIHRLKVERPEDWQESLASAHKNKLAQMAIGQEAIEAIFASAAPYAWPFFKGLATLPGGDGEPGRLDRPKLNLIGEVTGDSVDVDRSIEKIILVVADQRAGKDTWADLLTAMVGEQNVCNLQVSSFDDRFGLWPIVGKRIAMLREMHNAGGGGSQALMETGKLISGNSTISVRDLYSGAIQVKPGCRQWYFTNLSPTEVNDQSGAWAGRIVPIELKQSYYDREDPGVKQRVKADGKGALLVALYYAVRLRRKPIRRFDMTRDAEEYRLELERATAGLKGFKVDCCELKSATWSMLFEDLYDTYRWYTLAEMGRSKVIGKQNFSMKMRTQVPNWLVDQPTCGDRSKRLVYGIDVKDWAYGQMVEWRKRSNAPESYDGQPTLHS